MRALLFTALVAVSSSAPMAQEIVEANDFFVPRLTRAEVIQELERAMSWCRSTASTRWPS